MRVRLLLALLFLAACSVAPEEEAEWIPTREHVCIGGVCSEETIDCWTNTRTGTINCDPEFSP